MEKMVVVDLEMCKVTGREKTPDYRHSMETIQIGAVLVNEENEIIDTFNTYVHPEHGRIDSFVQELTGITNQDVEHAPLMREALLTFLEWIPEDAIVSSWSKTDSIQIRREAKSKGIVSEKLDAVLSTWVDCQEVFDKRINAGRQYNLQDALYAADIASVGKAHDGLTDAYNTALLMTKMRREPNMKLIPLYEGLRTEGHETLSFCLGDVFAALKIEGVAI